MANKARPRDNYPLVMVLLVLALILASLLALFGGPVRIGWDELTRIFSAAGDETASLILFQIRLPRLVMAAAVGAALAVAGAAFQGFFRNSLADPFVIGASSGAALGAALALTAGWTGSFLGLSPQSLCAFAGAITAVFLAFAISHTGGNPPPAMALLLGGTALSAFFSALLALITVLRDRALHQVYYWLLGSLGGASWTGAVSLIPLMAAGCLVVFLCARPLDLLIQGEEVAESLGVSAGRTRIIAALGASLAAAAAVAAAGVIGFVGLIAPHGARLFTGPGHRRLFPAAAIGGALLTLLADAAARNLAAPMELPIGIVTSLGGAPFFIYLLIRYGRNLGNR
ncbi:MAG: iron ABC transporter permease [Treponema sp.]|jgi:iron complex transport system permease protein|nr:iron ABC transporter permease [Treponema sp.]